MSTKTREEWLTIAAQELRKALFADRYIPEFKVSCGFPAGTRITKGKTGKQGQYWSGAMTDDGKPQVFISPEISDPIAALAMLTAMIVRVIYPDDSGNNIGLMLSLGFQRPFDGKSYNLALQSSLYTVSLSLGEYPHSKINLANRRVQETRLVKCVCLDCNYLVYTTQKHLGKGTPSCPNAHCGSYLKLMRLPGDESKPVILPGLPVVEVSPKDEPKTLPVVESPSLGDSVRPKTLAEILKARMSDQ